MAFWRKKDKAANGEVKIFFASDLHGSNVCFKKFVNGAKFYGADVLVLGGDLTGKAVIPIAEQQDGTFLALQHGEAVHIKDKAALDDFVKRQGNIGFYPVVMSESEYQALKSDAIGQAALFKRLVLERVREWAEFAAAKLKGTDIPLVALPGNDDFHEIDDILSQAPHFDFHEMQVCEFKGGYQMLYCGGSTPTPWDTEREYSEEQFISRFAELLPQVADMSRCIFNVHVPPFGTALDTCPKLDGNLQVVYEMGLPAQTHAGCKALVDVIKQHQPLLGLHGHVHEGRARINIGKTVCVNPGSVYPEGILQGAVITLQQGEITQASLTQG
ncbi:MAG: metallophosphoesterase family protein [Methyloceanibacter sp.]|uniref:metallophosphoesterase family protein n=1 Tax=Methyloceanibacter sp. TaxID=1965321 RepID=UPI003D6D0A98